MLDDLDPHQRAAVTATDALLAILAPAGSGKTRVLTRRIAFRVREGTADARHVLAVTFTRKAAGELVDRLARLGVDRAVTAGTFHALALAQLRRHATDRRREPPRVLDRKARILGPLLGISGPAAAVAVGDVATEIEWAKARLVSPDRYAPAARASGRTLSRSAEEVGELYARYEAEKRRRHLADFDDLLGACADAIASDEEFAAAQRWRFRHVFGDEFQDATPLQLRLLRAWLGPSADLCVVGDPAQAIYGFAGGDAGSLVEFARHFPGGRTVTLTRNYRSARPVVRLAEAALGPGAGVTRDPPRAVRPENDPPTITAYDDDAGEAAGVADRCWRAFAQGVPWHRIAVLFRTNAQSSLFEAALARRGVPFRVAGAGRFTSRPAVRALLDRLREAERAAPGRPFTDHLADLACDVDEGAPDVADDEIDAHRDALLRLGREYLAADGATGSLAGFVAWLDVATRAEGTAAPAVDLVTFHRAKGLEWHTVFVCGVERGLVPISWATTPDARAEERRLLHVALGRAEEHLHLSWARERTARGRRRTREPSPWLGELESHVPAGPPPDRRSELAAVRATLAAVAPPPPAPRRARR